MLVSPLPFACRLLCVVVVITMKRERRFNPSGGFQEPKGHRALGTAKWPFIYFAYLL